MSAINNVSERMCCNISTLVGEILPSHDFKRAAPETSMARKRYLRLGCTHDFATNEQLLNDC